MVKIDVPKSDGDKLDRRSFAKTIGSGAIGLGLAGCIGGSGNGSGGSQQGENLTFWHYAGGRHAEAQKQVAKNFQKQSNHKVNVRVWGDADAYHTTVLNALGTEQAPDSFGMTAINKFGQIVSAGNAMKASEYMRDDILDMYSDTQLNTVRYKNAEIEGWNNPQATLFGMPDNVSVAAIWYNKDVLKNKVGIDLNRVHHRKDMTWSEYVELLKEVDDAGVTPMSMSTGSWQARLQLTCHLSKAMGIKDYKQASLGTGPVTYSDSKQAAGVCRKLQKVAENGYINEDHAAIDQRTAVGYLARGEAAFHPQLTEIGSLLDAAAPSSFEGIPEVIDYMWFPYYEDLYPEGKNLRCGFANWSLGVANRVQQRDQAHRQAVYDWFNYRNTKEAWRTVFNTSGRLAPLDLDINKQNASGIQQVLLSMREQMQDANELSPYDVILLPEAFKFMKNRSSSLVSGRWSANKFLNELQAVIDKASS